jgi:ABC-type antimicrobial peptide transport system permease subunit
LSRRATAVGQSRRQLLVLLGAVAFVLLVACINVASLFGARPSARTNEIAVRKALGATRGRLTQQFLAEALRCGVPQPVTTKPPSTSRS